MKARGAIWLVLGGIMVVLGVYVLVRVMQGATVTGARYLDIAFAAVFMLRGVMNIKTALRRFGATDRPS